MGWLSDKLFGKRNRVNQGTLAAAMLPFKEMLRNQQQIGADLRDPTSGLNMRWRRMMSQRAAETGARSGRQMELMGNMYGVSPAQAMMQARMASNTAQGGVDDAYQNMLMQNFGTGLNLLNTGMGHQYNLSQGKQQQHIAAVNAHNARRNQRAGMGMSLLGGMMGGMGGGGGLLSNIIGGGEGGGGILGALGGNLGNLGSGTGLFGKEGGFLSGGFGGFLGKLFGGGGS